MQGDCLQALKLVPAASVDSVITDPPAGISFMGKAWDGDKGGRDEWIAWMSSVMKECLRVLKPGGHALVWAIPRTSHWTATAVEDAGFEVRDVVTHLFGSGFPKSLDISKAIDKEAWNDYLKANPKEAAHLRSLYQEIEKYEDYERELKQTANLERKKIGLKPYKLRKSDNSISENSYGVLGGLGAGEYIDGEITAPATPDAIKWQGFGTALKPAAEFWILARKPLSEKTVAKNVLKHGTGGLNIDASRITAEASTAQGRFPANLVLSGDAPELLDEQSGVLKTGGAGTHGQAIEGLATDFGGTRKPRTTANSSGGASRFFYCAKVSPSERNAGLEGMPDKEKRSAGGTTSSGKPTMEGRDRFGSITKNNHPTVKPQKLMQYLIKLITPPGGTVLDPFMGSGSTGLAAKNTGFSFIGIEQEPEYMAIAKARLA